MAGQVLRYRRASYAAEAHHTMRVAVVAVTHVFRRRAATIIRLFLQSIDKSPACGLDRHPGDSSIPAAHRDPLQKQVQPPTAKRYRKTQKTYLACERRNCS